MHGLDRRARSLVNLGILAASNRPNELKIHIRGALNNGVTRDEIREIFLQSALYLGVPTGSECTKIAKLLFAEMDDIGKLRPIAVSNNIQQN